MPQTDRGETPKNIISGIAISCLIFGLSGYLPIVGFICALLLPLPIPNNSGLRGLEVYAQSVFVDSGGTQLHTIVERPAAQAGQVGALGPELRDARLERPCLSGCDAVGVKR